MTQDYSDLCLIANGAKVDYRTLFGQILSGAIKRWQGRQRVLERVEDASGPSAPERDATAQDPLPPN